MSRATLRASKWGLLAILSCVAPVRAGQAQTDDVEKVARFLLDTPIYSSGDWFASVEGLAGWLREHADHPLADAGLGMLESLGEEPDDAAFLAERVLDLDPAAPWGSVAARRLGVLRGRASMVLAPLGADPQDLHPQFLHRFLVMDLLGWMALEGSDIPASESGSFWRRAIDPIAYLEPSWIPLDVEDDRKPADPGHGTPSWKVVERSPWRRDVHPLDALPADARGQLWLASLFDVAQGGPAWIEVETIGFGDLVGRDFAGSVPGYAVRIDDGEAQVSTQLEGEQPEVIAYGTVLRTGRNHIEIQTSLTGGVEPRFAIRVLAPDGTPYPGVVNEWKDEGVRSALGTAVAAKPPSAPLVGSIEYLQALPERGPEADALLGLLLARDGRRAIGLTHLRAAFERASDEPWLATHLALATLSAAHLPDAWRQGRAREIAERVLAAVPDHHAMGLFVASIQAAEDHEEESILRLERLTEVHGRSPQAPFALSTILQKISLDVRAEALLDESLLRAPNKMRTLDALADHLVSVGRAREAAETREKAARVSGGVAELVADAAEQWANAGEVERAIELMRIASSRDPALDPRFVALLIQARRLDEAEERLRTTTWHAQADEGIWRQRAAIAQLRGEPDTEREHLLRALDLQPSRRSTRERLRELTGIEPARDFLASQRLDVDAVLASYSGEGRQDSLVAVLDHAVTWVFEDGAVETLTQNVHQVRDLEACEKMKEIEAQGETLAIASIDGKTHERSEPVLVDGKYVMPALEPGDFVELTYRTLDPAPEDGLIRPGGWFFASLDQTFERSRYVISLPSGSRPLHPPLDLRIEKGNLEGVEQATSEEGDRIVHSFEARARARVAPEPGLPPLATFLPWVEVGCDDDPARIGHIFRAEALWNSRPMPEIAAAAEQVTSGIQGEEAQARALHRFVNDTLDERAWAPAAATQALLLRRGNATFLYLALLRARGIDAELVWSRGVTPRADEEAKPRFFDANRWRRQPLVLVRPRDGEQAWCEMQSTRLLPYGVLFGKVSEAQAFATLQQEQLVTPAVALEDGPSFAFEGTFHIDSGGAATVEGRVVPRAGWGFLLKEQAKNMPEKEVKANVRGLASQLVRGFTLQDFRFPGLAEDGVPITLEGEGTVKSFLDREQGGWVARLPIPPLGLSAVFAGQGERRLPFRFPGPIVMRALVRLELPASLDLVDPPEQALLTCPGGTYLLDVRRENAHTWIVERHVTIDAFDLPAKEFATFRAFCNQVDEAERARLHFRSK